MTLAYAIVLVHDMPASIAFYRDVCGLPLRFESSHWSEFDTGSATLALHIADAPSPASERGAAGQCRPGISVPDIDEFHQRLTAAGITCIQPPTETFGARIAQYLDPDGLVLSVSGRRGAAGGS